MNYNTLPSRTHTEPCSCPADTDNTQCYVWIHRPWAEGKVVTFNKISEAYNYGIKLVFAENGKQYEYDEPIWDLPLCKILKDISQNVKPYRNHWQYISTHVHQVLIGLGSTLPDEDIPMRGYTLEAHDKSADMPALFIHR